MNLKKVFLCGITAAYILTALPCTPAYALTLEQLSTDSSSIDVYFHDDGADLTTLTKENITATLDGTSIPIKSFEQSEERVNYMFLLDISRSVSEEYMTAAKQEILEIYENLNEKDLLSVITFGEEVHTILDGTETLEGARAILDLVHCDNWYTHFYDAVDLMLEKLEGVSDMHNIAVVVSDGINTGEANTTVDSLKSRFSGSGISLYALAVDTADASDIESFRDFIELSGGQLFTFSPETCTESMQELLLSVDNIWNISLEIDPALATGQSQLLEIQLGDQGTIQREVILEARELDTTPPTITDWLVDQEAGTLALYFSEEMADLKNPDYYHITNPEDTQVPVTVLEFSESYVLLFIDGLNENPGWRADFVRLMDASPNRNLLEYETILLTPELVEVAPPVETTAPSDPAITEESTTPNHVPTLSELAEQYWYIGIGILALILLLLICLIIMLVRSHQQKKIQIEMLEKSSLDEDSEDSEDDDLSVRVSGHGHRQNSTYPDDDLAFFDMDDEDDVHVNSQLHDKHIPTRKSDSKVKDRKNKENDPDIEVDKVSKHRKTPKIRKARRNWFLWKTREDIPVAEETSVEEIVSEENDTTDSNDEIDEKTLRKYVKPKKTRFKKHIIPVAEKPVPEEKNTEEEETASVAETSAAETSVAEETASESSVKTVQAPKSTLNKAGTSVKSGSFSLTGISPTKHTFHINLRPEIQLKSVTYKKADQPKSKNTVPKQAKAEKTNKNYMTHSLGSHQISNYHSSKPKNIHFTFTGDNQKK